MAQIARLSGSAGAKIVSLLMARQGHLEDTESPRALGRSRGDPGRIPAAVRLFYVIMADLRQPGVPGPQDDELMAIPRLAEAIGVTPRVLRYWEEQGLISPTREHGKLRYSPRDMAIARLTKRLLDAGMSVDGLGMIKELAQREIRWAAAAAADKVLSEQALRLLYQRKAFRETTGMDEEHYPEGRPPRPPHGPEGPEGHGSKPRGPRAHAHIPKSEH